LRQPISLPFVGYGALVAAGDALHSAYLRARLNRTRERLRPVLTPALLEQELHRGLESDDAGWAVTGAAAQQVLVFASLRDQMSAGVNALLEAGLLVPVARGCGFSQAGLAVAGDLASVQRITHATASARAQPHAGITFFESSRSAWMAQFSSTQESVRLIPATTDAISEALPNLIETKPPSPSIGSTCPTCGAQVGTQRFCHGCGRALRAAEKPTPKTRYCAECGAIVTKTFCTNCGAQAQP
jgi:hypothetical protein